MVAERIKNWLAEVSKTYTHSKEVYLHILQALSSWPMLKVCTNVYIKTDGIPEMLIKIHGLLPFKYKNNIYSIPITIWVPREYPFICPIFYVNPTENMGISPSNNIDPNGRFYHPLLGYWNWQANKSNDLNISNLIKIAQETFSHTPPAYAKPPQNVYTSTELDSDDLSKNISNLSISRNNENHKQTGLLNSKEVSKNSSSNNANQSNIAPPLPPLPPTSLSSQSPLPPLPAKSSAQSELQKPAKSPISTERVSVNGMKGNYKEYMDAIEIPLNHDTVNNHNTHNYNQSFDGPALPSKGENLRSDINNRDIGFINKDELGIQKIDPPMIVQVTDAKHAALEALNESLESVCSVIEKNSIKRYEAALQTENYVKIGLMEGITNEEKEIRFTIEMLKNSIKNTNESILVAEKIIKESKTKMETISKSESEEDKESEEFECISSENAVYSQLYNLIADDEAISDTFYALFKRMDKDKVDFENILRQMRQLGREQFLGRALIGKISSMFVGLEV